MGSDPEARLAYGFDLGGGEPWYLAEATREWGQLDIDWYDTDSDDRFADQLIGRLHSLIPDTKPVESSYDREDAVRDHWGVALVRTGDPEADTGYVLAAIDPGRDFLPGYRSVEWSETMPLDLHELTTKPAEQGWDDKLTAAIKALGITPVREDPNGDGPRHKRDKVPVGPSWLVFPYYG